VGWWDGRCHCVMAGISPAMTKKQHPRLTTRYLNAYAGLSGPSLSAPAVTDGPDKPGHDGVATIVLPARYFNAYGMGSGGLASSRIPRMDARITATMEAISCGAEGVPALRAVTSAPVRKLHCKSFDDRCR
ncbi:MAG: hypothetical protein ACJ8AI_14435, partial [Rhodopila sp.]